MHWIKISPESMPPTNEPFWATGWKFDKPGNGRWYVCAVFDGKVFEAEDDPNNEPIYVPTHWAHIEQPTT